MAAGAGVAATGAVAVEEAEGVALGGASGVGDAGEAGGFVPQARRPTAKNA